MGDPRRQFDFWLGEWRCSWDGGEGRNTVDAICDGQVIRESFDASADALVGTSISLYDEAANRWVQTWNHSQGSWFHLRGQFRDGAMELFTTEPDANGETKRMRFHDIGRDGFTWTWSSAPAAGEWSQLWQIGYRRA